MSIELHEVEQAEHEYMMEGDSDLDRKWRESARHIEMMTVFTEMCDLLRGLGENASATSPPKKRVVDMLEDLPTEEEARKITNEVLK